MNFYLCDIEGCIHHALVKKCIVINEDNKEIEKLRYIENFACLVSMREYNNYKKYCEKVVPDDPNLCITCRKAFDDGRKYQRKYF